MADSNGRQTNTLDYRYYNAGPGTVAAASSAVGSKMETTSDVLNPAFASTKLYAASQQGTDAGFQLPGSRIPAGADEQTTPDTGENLRDNENTPITDHSAQPPKAPTSVAAVAGIAGHATVTWVAPVDADGYAITGYEVTATSVTSGATTPVVATVGNVLTLNMSGLTSAKVYTFSVKAINLYGKGAQSAVTGNVTIV